MVCIGNPAVEFRRQVIDLDPLASQHDITFVAEINGNGRNAIIIGGKQGNVSLFWYENPSWAGHDMAPVPHLEAGGVVLDINGSGRLDVAAGLEWDEGDLYWFEGPPGRHGSALRENHPHPNEQALFNAA